DGIGLGADDSGRNPFARAHMPHLESLLDGRRLLADSAPYVGERATLLGLDASLGVQGLPQSATGQAVLLTGTNVPERLGEHYGPKPNPAVAEFLRGGGLFSRVHAAGKTAALLNAYPPRYFEAVESGRRLYSSIPLAVTSAGLRLFDKEDLFAGRALSADFTGAGWASMLGFPEAPVMSPATAGVRLAGLARNYDFSFFEYWSTDYAGHKQDMGWALQQLDVFDEVLGGLIEAWQPTDGLILLTSDHGNMEDLSTRRHTTAEVPALLIGARAARDVFAEGMTSLLDIAPAVLRAVQAPI
ncbi:MAG: metalloenzyme domain-containing protein, partial [Anaerolineales bacterium]